MGGGDLNLKKSWHPHTMKNQEKVWKAEQAKISEENRVKELQKEIEEERNREDLRKIGQTSGVLAQDSSKKLEWMYKSSTDLLNRDEYLLGRSIDKNFEQLDQQEKLEKTTGVGVKIQKNHVEHEVVPFSIRQYRGAESTEQVDLQRKIMEDPLMAIKEKEMESRRKILENPVKLKELHRILKTEGDKSKKRSKKKLKKEKKQKKSKKSKKKESSSSESESNEDDLDKLLAKHYKKLGGNSTGADLEKLLDDKYKTISKELDKTVKNKTKRSNSSDSSENNHRSSSNEDQRSKNQSPRRNFSSGRRNWNNLNQNRGKNQSSPQRNNYSDRRNRNYSPKWRNRTPSPDRRHRNPSPSRNFRNRSRSRSIERRNRKSPPRQPRRQSPPRQPRCQSPPRQSRRDSPERNSKPKVTKLTDEERKQRLYEMTQNAVWRDEDRSNKVQKYRDDYKKEEDAQRSSEFDKDFINKEVHKAMKSQDSIESRLKANRNNIQRTSNSMNSNFVKK